MLVEDQIDARRMMQLLLEAEGVEVHMAENGLEGARLIERIGPELAIVDLGLPVMSGYDLARRIRRNQRLARVAAGGLEWLWAGLRYPGRPRGRV